MSQHQAGFAGVPVKRLKQTALTWKVKDKATSQLARRGARLSISGINHWGQREIVLPKVLTGETAVLISKFRLRRVSAGSCFVRSHKGHITYYNFEAVSVKFQFHLYMTSVGSRGAGLPYKSIIKYFVPLHLKTMIHAHIHTHILTYYGICVCMDTYILEYY